jgi:hypothetical protein
MDESDIYYVDTRNADHRTGAGGSWAQPVRAVVARPTRVYTAAPYPAPYPSPYAAPYGNSPLASSLFGRMTTGQMIDLVAQIFAALMPLPAAPTATSDAPTDVGNLILYQGALAQYAKRDEQVRTIGNLVTKMVG